MIQRTSSQTFALLIDRAYTAMAGALQAGERVRTLTRDGADRFELQLAEDEAFAALEHTRVAFESITAQLRGASPASAQH